MSRVLERHIRGCADGLTEEGRMSSEDRRRQLIRIAINLFSQKGFSGTTTKEIAREAGVTEAIVFRHFPTKDALYSAILDYKANESRIDDWLEEVKEYVERRDDETIFRSLISRILEHHRQNREFTRLMLYSALERHSLAKIFRENHGNRLTQFLLDYITLRQQEGAFQTCNPEAVTQAIIALPVFYALDKYLFESPNHITETEAVGNFTQLLLNGLRTNPLKTRSLSEGNKLNGVDKPHKAVRRRTE